MSETSTHRARGCGRVGQVRVDLRSYFGGAARRRDSPDPSGGRCEPAVIDEVWLGLLAERDGLPLPDSAAGLVLGLEPRELSQEGRLAAVAVAERTMAALAAVQAALIAEIARVERDEAGSAVDSPEQEVLAVALAVSPVTAGLRSHNALELCDRLPAVWSAQRRGRVSAMAARALVEETTCLDTERAREVADRLLAWAPGKAPGVVRRRAAALVAKADPVGHAVRHQRARACRSVRTFAEADGMASLWWTADAVTIAAARDTIDGAARRLLAAHTGGDEGREARVGLEAARSDALAALLLDGEANLGPTAHQPLSPGRRTRPVVAVHIGLGTLLGADDTPCAVPGLGHAPAEAARRIAADSDWQVFLHGADGQLAAVATRAYTPTPAMAALVVARDRTCRFPGCAQPAHRCDLDHRVPYDHHDPERGGPTSPDNLQALCRRHHNLKTAGTWTVTHAPEGTLNWVGPRGTRARVEPDDPDPPR